MFYEKKIRYLNYFEEGERIKGSGFIKSEARDAILRIEVAIKNPGGIEGIFPVYLLGAEREAAIGEINLQENGGELRVTYQMAEGIGETALSYDEWNGVRIPLASGRDILANWGISKRNTTSVDMQSAEKQKYKEEQNMEEAEMGQKRTAEEKGAAEKNRIADEKKTYEEIGAAEEKKSIEEKRACEKRGAVTDETERIAEKRIIRLQEDKWLQLCTIYPHIKPFRDEREYLSITPSDFVLFPAADYRAAHNSFLLHGYYNYQHLVLARIERKGEILYYVGVPGNYFEKEKQVAIMFGFESFECAEEPAEYGDFGYYMMRTNI